MKIAIVYGSTTGSTARVAERLLAALGPENVALFAEVSRLAPGDLAPMDVVLAGGSTWYMGELQDDWEVFCGRLSEADLSGTRLALFGTGDQEDFPDHFVDAIGLLHERLAAAGACTGYGCWPTAGYRFLASRAVSEGRFLGLPLDENNQPDLTGPRLEAWLRQLARELDLPVPAAEVATARADAA